jgi:hypothetical protein
VGDPPVVEHQNTVGEREGLIHVVRDEQHGGRLMPDPQADHEPVHGDPGQRVERAERLVEQQQPRLADQGPRQRGPLRLAAGQRDRPGRSALGQPDLLKRGPGGGLRVGGSQAKRDVGQHLLPRNEPGFLKRDRHGSRHADLAGHFLVKPGQRAQQRRLARAAAPDQRDEFAGGNVHVEPVKHDAVAELAAQPADGRRRGGPGLARGRRHSPFGWIISYSTKSRRHASAFLSSRRTAPLRSRPRMV